MDMTNDAANAVVNQTMTLTIEGTKMLLSLSGKGAVRIAAIIAAVLQEQYRTKGAVRLATLVRAGGNQEVFTIHQDQLATWAKAAKMYNVMYTVIKDNNRDGMIDLFVRADDAARINRFMERFGIVLTPEAHITAAPAPEQDITPANPVIDPQSLDQETDQILNEILAPPEPVMDEVSQVIEEALEPDVPEEEFNALFQDTVPMPDPEDLPDPSPALLPDNPSVTQSGPSPSAGSNSKRLSETTPEMQQGNSPWTLKRVNEVWPLTESAAAFSDEQKYEIHKGFASGLSVEQIDRFAKPEYTADTMRVLRESMRPSVKEAINRIRAEKLSAPVKSPAKVLEKAAQPGKGV